MLNKESNYLTNQELIRLINVLRSMVVKCWTVDDFDNKDDRKYNKLIIKELVPFYSECWLDRCEALHNEDKQKEQLSQWCNNVLSMMENEHVSARRHLVRTKLHASVVSND